MRLCSQGSVHVDVAYNKAVNYNKHQGDVTIKATCPGNSKDNMETVEVKII